MVAAKDFDDDYFAEHILASLDADYIIDSSLLPPAGEAMPSDAVSLLPRWRRSLYSYCVTLS